jgi:sporulation protein YlmC with PRC-barrel domain
MKKYRLIAPLLITALLLSACTPPEVEQPDTGVLDETPGALEPSPGSVDETPALTPEVTPEITPAMETPQVEETPLPVTGTPLAVPPATTPETTPGTVPEAIGPISHLSTLMDFEITDGQGQRLGVVEDFVVDASLEVVLYAVANLENQQATGMRTVAIPYNSMRIDRTQQSFQNKFRLTIDPELLEAAPEIDTATIDFSAEDWFVEFETFWDNPEAALSPQETPQAEETEEFEETEEGEETEVAEEPTPTPLPEDARVQASAILASNLLGAEVVHGETTEIAEAGSETLGTVAEVILDPVSGRTQHLVIEAGEQMAAAGDWIPVPLTQVLISRLATDITGEELVVQVEQERLAGAPSFEMGQLPDTTEPGWDAGVREYWTVQ